MIRSYLSIAVLMVLFAPSGAFAGGLEGDTPAVPKFGTYYGIFIDSEVIQGVRVDAEDKIWILLNPTYRNEELVLKISNDYKSSYRNWHNGEKTLISPGGQNKAPNEWTDWVRTSSNYIEYWMGDRMVLHLKKGT